MAGGASGRVFRFKFSAPPATDFRPSTGTRPQAGRPDSEVVGTGRALLDKESASLRLSPLRLGGDGREGARCWKGSLHLKS